MESENFTLNDNLAKANSTIEDHVLKEKDFEENVNALNHKVQTLEKTEEDLLVCVIIATAFDCCAPE